MTHDNHPHGRTQALDALGQPSDPGPLRGVFEVSLALTGTTSAGAYTAGVLDFLRLALDAWEEARARGEAVPQHRVLLKGIAGTSGGSISGTVFAAGLTKAQPGSSFLHQVWVEQLGLEGLLQVPAALEKPLPSLLNSEGLDQIARDLLDALETAPEAPWRPWASDPMTLRLTLSNLTGVPYWLPMEGAERGGDGYTMILHQDYAGYGVTPTGAPPQPGDLPLPVLTQGGGQAQAWATAMASAIGSAAVPVAFRTRTQDFSVALRNARPLVSALAPGQVVVVPPAWPETFGDAYRSYNADGSMVSNEPLDLAREILAGAGGRNERRPEHAQRMVLMVGPLVHGITWSPTPVEAFWNIPGALEAAAYETNQFKLEDLVLASRKEVASRWLITPKAPPQGPDAPFAPPTPIIGAGLGHFAAFLHPVFRQHDYDLGRYNCQSFLKNWFCLPANNPGFVAGGAGELPLIPLVGAASVPVPAPAYPGPGTFTPQDLERFQELLGQRLDYIKDCLGATFATSWMERAALWVAWEAWGRHKLIQGATRTVTTFLTDYRL